MELFYQRVLICTLTLFWLAENLNELVFQPKRYACIVVLFFCRTTSRHQALPLLPSPNKTHTLAAVADGAVMGALKKRLRRRHALVSIMCSAFSNSKRPWFGGLFIGRVSRQLSKVVIIYDHYININGEFWLECNAFRMFQCMTGGSR